MITNYYESTCHSENPCGPFHILLDQLVFSLTFNFSLNKSFLRVYYMLGPVAGFGG